MIGWNGQREVGWVTFERWECGWVSFDKWGEEKKALKQISKCFFAMWVHLKMAKEMLPSKFKLESVARSLDASLEIQKPRGIF